MVNDGKCMENNKSGELTVLYFYYKIIINMLISKWSFFIGCYFLNYYLECHATYFSFVPPAYSGPPFPPEKP